MSGKIVIAAYRAKPERKEELLEIMKKKRAFMLKEGYYSTRAPIVMASSIDPDLVIEVIEWTSEDAISKAHSDSRVMEIWKEMDEICYEIGSKPESFPEAGHSFPNFEPLNLY